MIDDDHNSTESNMTMSQSSKKKVLQIDTTNIQMGRRLGLGERKKPKKRICVSCVFFQGGSGCAVYACNVDGWECAVKELKIANAKQSDVDSFSAEIFMLESLPAHKNLVRFLFHEKTSDRIRVFMRRYEGTLDVYLKNRMDKVFFCF